MLVEGGDLAQNIHERFRVGILFRTEGPLVGVPAHVPPRERGDGRVIEDQRGVTRQEIPAIDPLANQQCPTKGAIIVGDVDLHQAIVDARNLYWRAAHAQARVLVVHPERRVAGHQQKLCRRR